MNHDEAVSRIIALQADAARAEADANRYHWEAAELIAHELETGISQRQLAREIGKSQGHVSKCAVLWARCGSDSLENRPAWRDAYRSVSGKRPPDQTAPAATRPATATAMAPDPLLVRQLRHEIRQLERQLEDQQALRETTPAPGPVDIAAYLGVTPGVAIIRILNELTEFSARLMSGPALAGADRDRALAAWEQIPAVVAEIGKQLTASAEPERRGVAQAMFSDERADTAWQRIKGA